MEQNGMKVVNINASDDQADVEMNHKYEKDTKCKAEKQDLLVSLNELTEKCCETKDKQPEINEHISNQNNEYVSCADVIQSQQLESGPYYESTSEIEIIPESNDVFGHKLETEHNFEFGFKETEDFNLSCDETNIISNSYSDSLYTDSFSCSLYSSLSSPSSSFHFSCLPGTSNEHSEYSWTNEQDLLFSYLEKMFDDKLEPISEYNEIIETKEDVENFETLSLVKSDLINDTLEYDLLQYVLENVKFEDNNEVHRNSECFVGDRIIVNPDIMYNINLNEYYNELDLLALKVLRTPDDPTALVEYKLLPPIPQIEQTHGKFTAEERFRFANGISEYQYQIDRDDWNKIMVKRSVVFTAHAGFSIANEESLYVLADVAIDYVKKLAVIMKKHFDIQANNSNPDSIDPIDNSLQEVSLIFM